MQKVKRFIFTGMPGSGKTSVLQLLKQKGYTVVSEAATDVISIEQAKGVESPWESLKFIGQITHMQKERQMNAMGDLQFYDRSPFCTVSLEKYLKFQPVKSLRKEVDRCLKNGIYQSKVFFFENLGFIENTDARKISYEEALLFEKIHFDIYQKFGFDIIMIPMASIEERCRFVLESI